MKAQKAELTQMQRLFAEAYIGPAKGNARKAARLAGYSGNDNVLSQRAFELTRNPKIASLIGGRIEGNKVTKSFKKAKR